MGVANTFRRTQALLFGGPPTVDVRMPVAFALIVPTGGLRPPLLCCGANACRRKNDFCDVQTHVQESGGRQPAVGLGNTFAQTQALLFGRPPTVYVPMAVAFALIVPTGGLRPPLLALLQRPSAGRMTTFAVHKRTCTRAAGVSPPWCAKPSLRDKNQAPIGDWRTQRAASVS
jgi:hypothetical protein